jgi:hypothetical protein
MVTVPICERAPRSPRLRPASKYHLGNPAVAYRAGCSPTKPSEPPYCQVSQSKLCGRKSTSVKTILGKVESRHHLGLFKLTGPLRAAKLPSIPLSRRQLTAVHGSEKIVTGKFDLESVNR